jgi:hypothetical protein
MIKMLQRATWKATAVLAGLLVFIVGVSYLPAAPPRKPGAAPVASSKPAVAGTDSSKPNAAKKDPSKLTRANYDLIHNGMKEDEVTAILGAPGGSSKNVGTFNGRPFDRKGMIWKTTDWSVTIKVKFTDGKVSDKEWIKLSPQQQAEVDFWMKAAGPKPQK